MKYPLWILLAPLLAPGCLLFTDFATLRCGDGFVVSDAEGCDDGNNLDGDGCDRDCAVEPDAECAGAPSDCITVAEVCAETALIEPFSPNSGDTSDGTSLFTNKNFGCSPGLGRELVFLLPPTGPGLLDISINANTPHVLYARSLCEIEDSEIFCIQVQGISSISLPTDLVAPLFLFVDANQPGDEGPFELFVFFQPSICGDGNVTPPENCDDGNGANGDGCDANCQIEPTCNHDVCTPGGPLLESCEPCTAQVCAKDPVCCQNAWDDVCVNLAGSLCGAPCP
jgi:cysteine-rich repeat protein